MARNAEEPPTLAVDAARPPLGVDREAPVGFSAVRLSFELDTDADEDQLAKLRKLTEPYCVVYQTLAGTPALSTSLDRVESRYVGRSRPSCRGEGVVSLRRAAE